MSSIESIQAPGLNRLTAAELTEFMQSWEPPLPADAVKIERDAHSGEYGEPGTIIAIVSIVALKAFVAWLATRPRNDRITQEITIKLPDGTVITKVLDVEMSTPGKLEPKLAEQILSTEGLSDQARAAIEAAITGA